MVKVPLTQGKIALVDEADLPQIEQHRWCAVFMEKWYAATKVNRKLVLMHRYLMGLPSCKVDHKDGNGLNNQRHNLRLATDQQSAANRRKLHHNTTSRYKGVVWDAQRQAWRARIMVNRKLRHLGRFRSEEEAARAYDQAAREIFGEYASLNF